MSMVERVLDPSIEFDYMTYDGQKHCVQMPLSVYEEMEELAKDKLPYFNPELIKDKLMS